MPAATLIGEASMADQHLVRDEALGVFHPAFDATQTHQAQKRLAVPPVAPSLGREALLQQSDLAGRDLFAERDVVAHSAEVTVPLRDLVMQDEGVSPHGRNQFAN